MPAGRRSECLWRWIADPATLRASARIGPWRMLTGVDSTAVKVGVPNTGVERCVTLPMLRFPRSILSLTSLGRAWIYRDAVTCPVVRLPSLQLERTCAYPGGYEQTNRLRTVRRAQAKGLPRRIPRRMFRDTDRKCEPTKPRPRVRRYTPRNSGSGARSRRGRIRDPLVNRERSASVRCRRSGRSACSMS
jgi:hypothetical protein